MTIDIPKIPHFSEESYEGTPEGYARRVARGAEWLDAAFPGWERKVDLEILDISSADNCICGQVVPAEMVAAAKAEYRYYALVDDSFSSPFAHGFLDPAHGDYWVALIKDRFNTGELSDAAFEGAETGGEAR